MKTDGVWVIVWAQLDIQAREAGWDPRADAGGEVGRESRTAEVSSARGQGLEGAWRVGRSEHEAGQRAGPRKVHELPRDAAGPSAAPRKGCRRHGRGPTVRPGCTGSPRTVRSPSRAGRRPSPHPAHDGAPQPKGPPTRRRTRIELRLDALAERIAQGELRHLRHTAVQPLNLCHRAHGASPFRHGIVSSTRPLPIRTNITRQGEAPEGRAPQHEAESAPGWTGQQRRSTRNRRGVTTVPASVSLGQVMMPTNPEMLQRSAERAQQYKAVQHELDDRNIPNKGLSVPPSSPIAKCASADLQRYKSQPSPSHRSAPSPTHPTANVPERENDQLNMPPFISARA